MRCSTVKAVQRGQLLTQPQDWQCSTGAKPRRFRKISDCSLRASRSANASNSCGDMPCFIGRRRVSTSFMAGSELARARAGSASRR